MSAGRFRPPPTKLGLRTKIEDICIHRYTVYTMYIIVKGANENIAPAEFLPLIGWKVTNWLGGY